MINFLRRLFGLHDNFGLKHSTPKLAQIQREIAFYPLERQSEFADNVCVVNAKNDDFLRSQFKNFDPADTAKFTNLNATAVGNLAFIALHGSIPEIREKCKQALANYRNYLSSF